MPVVPHEFDSLTKYCRRCGAAMEDVLIGARGRCDQLGNVLGISHILCKRSFETSGFLDLHGVAAIEEQRKYEIGQSERARLSKQFSLQVSTGMLSLDGLKWE